MSNSGTPTGEIGNEKESEEIKVSYVDDTFEEKHNFEICCIGIDFEVNIEKYFKDNNQEEKYKNATPEEQAAMRREAIKLGKLEMIVPEQEKLVKQQDKKAIKEGKGISTKDQKGKEQAVKNEKKLANEQKNKRLAAMNQGKTNSNTIEHGEK